MLKKLLPSLLWCMLVAVSTFLISNAGKGNRAASSPAAYSIIQGIENNPAKVFKTTEGYYLLDVDGVGNFLVSVQTSAMRDIFTGHYNVRLIGDYPPEVTLHRDRVADAVAVRVSKELSIKNRH